MEAEKSLDPGVAFMLLNVAALLGVVLLCWVVNLLVRRPALNGWYWGILAVVATSTWTAWQLTVRGAFDGASAFRQGEGFGEHVGGPALLPILLALWRGRAFRNRKRDTAVSPAQ